MAEPLTPEREARLRQALTEALRNWNSHGRPIAWEVRFPYGRFVEIIAEGPVSGCATDTLFRAVLALAQPLPSEYVCTVVGENIFVEKFYEIVKRYRAGEWPEAGKVIEARAEGLQAVPLQESRLRIHL